MKEIKRYAFDTSSDYEEAKRGPWVKFEEVEGLQKELIDVTAKALAVVWLVCQFDPNSEDLARMRELHEEAREVLMGKDKQTITRLEDRITQLQLELDRLKRPPPHPGVAAVIGEKASNPGVDYALSLLDIQGTPYDGLRIRVRLP
jgi:hypothetical protein